MPKTIAPALSKVAQKKKTARTSKVSREKEFGALSICPTNGAGWCPYPFSVKQLERRLKAKSDAEKAKLDS